MASIKPNTKKHSSPPTPKQIFINNKELYDWYKYPKDNLFVGTFGGIFCVFCGCSQFSFFLFALNLDCVKASRVLHYMLLSACIIISFTFLVWLLAILYIILIRFGRILLYVHNSIYYFLFG